MSDSVISNLSAIKSLLNGSKNPETGVTVGLTVTGSTASSVTLQASDNADLMVTLRGVTAPVGSVITVDLNSGAFVVVSTPAAPVKAANPAARQGCSSTSFLAQSTSTYGWSDVPQWGTSTPFLF